MSKKNETGTQRPPSGAKVEINSMGPRQPANSKTFEKTMGPRQPTPPKPPTPPKEK
ncbi:hypothetical protein ACVDG3_06780 [Meridianimarinicoccus sp. RP-17]|uniref:hypothetical protein n=1 Tax=Meridianimarinicoccus zhengii TaxID=2056810 RepID=UPI0013A6CB46|nr:hypothetical protein [Phycocomes zhengii]